MAKVAVQRRVTVIDDSPHVLTLFDELLGASGMEVSLLEESASLREIEESDPDLIVVDLRLGAQSLAGRDIIRLVRAHRHLRAVPIIVCSAAVDEIAEHGEAFREIPDLYVLPKPFSLDALELCVSQALGVPIG